LVDFLHDGAGAYQANLGSAPVHLAFFVYRVFTAAMNPKRRTFLIGAAGAVATSALGQTPHAGHGDEYESLQKPGRIGLPDTAHAQRSYDSPAPKAANQGQWSARPPLPLPRSEMAWAVAHANRMHVLGGYAEQRVDRPYHHVYDPASSRWLDAPPLPRGANHVGVAVMEGRLFAIGGHLDQNRKPDDLCFALDFAAGRWSKIAPLPNRCGAVAVVAYRGRIHAVGGAIGDTSAAKKSIDWHLAYDPGADRWEKRAPMPTGRDHTGTLVVGPYIHVVGGRVDNFHTNSNLHHVYDGTKDAWEVRRPLPTARSGHGAVLYRGRIFVVGGEGTDRVFAQNEAYDPQTDRWEAYAPMLTPRHGLGAAVVGDAIHVAGGGPVMGGGVQSAVHEAFRVDA
jgi:Kelch motif